MDGVHSGGSSNFPKWYRARESGDKVPPEAEASVKLEYNF